MIETIVRLAAGVALTVANAFFVTTEFALTRVRQFPRSRFAQDARCAAPGT